MTQPRFASRALCAAISLLATPLAWSAGAEVPVIAISSQGTSNANSAEARDASVIFYNPAGMALLRGTQVSQPFALIAASTTVKDTGTTRVQDLGQAPDTGDSADCATYDCMSDPNGPNQPAVHAQPGGIFPKVLPVAALFASTPINDTISVGLGVFSPGGGNLNYKKDWFGRYFVDSTAIETVNINPTVSIRLDDKHSLGFGVSALVGHAKLKQQIDVAKIAPYLLQPILEDAGPLGGEIAGNLLNNIPGLGPLLNSLLGPTAGTVGSLAGQTVSGLLNALKGTPLGTPLLSPVTGILAGAAVDDTSTASATVDTFGFGYGWNIGYMYQFSDKTRLGISYRSESDIRMNGKLDWDLTDLRGGAVEGILTPPTLQEFLIKHYRPDTDARLIFTIPAKLNVGFFTELTDKLDFMLNYTFNKSSVVKDLTVRLPNQSDTIAADQGAARIAQNWRDSHTLAAGINYHWSDKLTLRTGLQFDQTPVSSENYRHPGLADNDRWMASFGIGYRIDRNTSIDLAYSYLYILPSDANFHETCTGTYYERENNAIGGPSECTANGGTFRARYEDSHAHILGLQLNKRL